MSASQAWRRLPAPAHMASRMRPLLLSPPRVKVVGAVLAHLPQRRGKFSWSNINPFRSRVEQKTPQRQGEEERKMRDMWKSLAEPRLGPSMFEDEVKSEANKAARAKKQGTGPPIPEHQLAMTQDPDPQNRERWERKMVIRMIQRNGRESRRQVIARTERQALHKSPFVNTSVKKMVKVARQVAGKTVDDALLQMKFSKKKAARYVHHYLERARDTAVAVNGMGLGSQKGQPLLDVPRTIKTKKGAWVDVKDATSLYVAEAWVMRGPQGIKRVNYMGRGRVSYIRSHATGISLVLKEEKTRIREHDERVAKQRRRGPWLHHQDRPVTAQRQYYTW